MDINPGLACDEEADSLTDELDDTVFLCEEACAHLSIPNLRRIPQIYQDLRNLPPTSGVPWWCEIGNVDDG